MKYILFILILLPSICHAQEITAPWNPCFADRCTPTVKAIADEFMNAGGITDTNTPFVSSGSCYHQSYELNPEIEHHGVVLIDLHEGRHYTGGQYSFFYQQNPYREWTVQTARDNTQELYQPNHELMLFEDFAYADLNPGGSGKSIVRYWMRQKDNILYVVGLWGMSHTIVCRMEKNPQQ